MNKEKNLEIIDVIKKNRNKLYEKEVLDQVREYISSQETYSYEKTMQYIQSLKSNKLGGIYGYINKVLEYLKNAMKKVKRDGNILN